MFVFFKEFSSFSHSQREEIKTWKILFHVFYTFLWPFSQKIPLGYFRENESGVKTKQPTSWLLLQSFLFYSTILHSYIFLFEDIKQKP